MNDSTDPSNDLRIHIAGEIALSDHPGETLRKWRHEFGLKQVDLSHKLGISSSVLSDYEGGRRPNPGVNFIQKIVNAMIDTDASTGGIIAQRYASLSEPFSSHPSILSIHEYTSSIPLSDFYTSIGGHEIVPGPMDITGYTIVDSILAITTLSADNLFKLYGRSTNRAIIFTNVSRGESPLVAMRVVSPTPSAVILHGISEDQLWEHAPALASISGFSLGITNLPINTLLTSLQKTH